MKITPISWLTSATTWKTRDIPPDFAEDGINGLHLATVNDYDAIVLDLMLPGIDGLDVCRKLRKEAMLNTPVLILTARDSLNDKLIGFEAGGDDYLTKPFALAELEARLLALVRRLDHQDNQILQVADLQFDTQTLSIKRASQRTMATLNFGTKATRIE